MYMYMPTYVYFIVKYLIFGSFSQIVEKHTKCARYCGPYKGKEVRELPNSGVGGNSCSALGDVACVVSAVYWVGVK